MDGICFVPALLSGRRPCTWRSQLSAGLDLLGGGDTRNLAEEAVLPFLQGGTWLGPAPLLYPPERRTHH